MQTPSKRSDNARVARRQRGMTIPEVLVAVGMVAVLVFATVTVTSTALQGTKNNMDRQFATQKAIAMLEELRALIQVNSGTQITVLDGYNDESLFRNRLTTKGLLTDPPGDPISGNTQVNGQWLYSRQISVKPLQDPSDSTIIIGSTDVRLVRVRVYKNERGGQRLLAEVAGVVRTLAVSFPPSQVYDVYCVAIENVPGWWVNMSTLIPFVQNAISDLQSRNPGLNFRQRWITKLSYGRDLKYTPWVNESNDSLTAINWVYFYPGLMPDPYVDDAGGASHTPAAEFYYPPGNFTAMIRTENGVQNGFDSSANPDPYTLADQYNHVMRYEDEKILYNTRVNAVNGSGQAIYPNEQPTLRLLLEDMYRNPTSYTNAIIVNLHGELLPFPPLRNYSDAAKKPDYYAVRDAANNTIGGVRVVTHPERLAYDTGTLPASVTNVNLRVYSYVTNPNFNNIASKPGGVWTALSANREFLPEPITIVLRGVNWDPATAGGLQAITGGVDLDQTVNSGTGGTSSRDPYSVVSPALTTDLTSPSHRMYYVRSYIAPPAGVGTGDTVIKLYNSPLVSPCVPTAGDCTVRQDSLANTYGSGGIEHASNGVDTKRLYGMEYLPSPMENFAQATAQTPFAINLATQGTAEKNTARWVLQIPLATFPADGAYRVETRIGDYAPATNTFSPAYPAAGAVPYDSPDLSTTYIYRGSDAWMYGSSVSIPNLPITERFQFIGDPRHCPYADLKMPHTTNSAAWHADNVDTKLGMGYNRYFDDFENTTDHNMNQAEMDGTIAGNYAIVTGTNDKCAVKIDGGATINTALTAGVARTPAQVVADLNGNATFTAVATAYVFSSAVAIRSNSYGPGSSVMFDNTVAKNAASTLGFTYYSSQAEMDGTAVGAYAVVAGNNDKCAVKINGGATITVTLTAGVARTVAQVVADLNASAALAAVATAININSTTVGIRSNMVGAGSSVAFDTTVANNSATLLGFTLYSSVHPATQTWPGWTYTVSGTQYGVSNNGTIGDANWATTNGNLEVDLPRVDQVWRTGLSKTNSLYTTMTGFPYYYLGIGNEIGYDSANGWDWNVPVNSRPFDGNDTSHFFEQSITPGEQWGDGDTDTLNRHTGVKYIMEGDGSWWGINWLGELYPDKMYDVAATTNDWSASGNLPTGTPAAHAAGTYRRTRRDDSGAAGKSTPVLPANNATDYTHTPGTTFGHAARRTHEQGVGMFFWVNSSSKTLLPNGGGATGTITASPSAGTDVQNYYNFSPYNPIDANRPFVINGTPPTTEALGDAYYFTTLFGATGSTVTVTQQATFYDSNVSGDSASALLVNRRGSTNDAMFVVENGLSPTTASGTDFIARWAFLSLIQGFFEAGQFNGGAAPAVTELPRVRITQPNPNVDLTGATTVPIAWQTDWKRWDGRNYDSQAGSWNTSATLNYLVLYSADNGVTWYYANDPSTPPRPATPGNKLASADARWLTTASYNWATPAGATFVAGSAYPAGEYIIRVETYRSTFPLHYSYHQYALFLNR